MAEIVEVMSRELITTTPDNTLLETIDILTKYNITGLPVVDDNGKVVGIISEKNVLVLLHKIQSLEYSSDDAKMKVSDFMTKEVVSFEKTDTLSNVCKCLMTSNFRRVPITSNGKLVGIISRKDLLSLARLPAPPRITSHKSRITT